MANVIFFSAILFTLYLFAFESKEDISVFRLYVLGFILRVALAYLNCYYGLAIPGDGDAITFHYYALDNLTSQEGEKWTNYTQLLTFIYKLTDCSRFFAQYLNVLMGIIFLIWLNKTLKLLNIQYKIRIQTLGIATFMPNLIVFSAILLREAWIEMFIMLSIYYFVKWFLTNKNWWYAITSVLLVICAAWMHSGCIVIVFGYFLCFLLYDKNLDKIKLSRSSIIALLFMALFCLFVITNIGLFMEKFGSYDGQSTSDLMVDMYSSSTDAGSAYLLWLNVTSPLQAFLFAPLKMFYFLFSPIPFDWKSLMDIIAFLLDSSVYIFLFYKLYKLRKDIVAERKNLLLFLLISFFVTTFVFSFGTIASGTAIRHRAKIVSFLFVCYSLTKVNYKDKQLKNKTI